MIKQLNFLAYILILTLVLSSNTSAYQTTFLQLVITDQNGDSILGKNIRLKNGTKIIKEITDSSEKIVLIPSIIQGQYTLEIEASGFKPVLRELNVKEGRNEISIKLEIPEIIESVQVEQDKQDKALDTQSGAFTNFLTKDQLEALPEEPAELEKALKQQFGQDAVIRVDGFSGKMPPKSAIASIRVSRSSFDAEYHQLGSTFIDVISKAGLGNWHGSISHNVSDESLNARSPFAQNRFPSQNRRFDLLFLGPIVKGKTSIFGVVSGEDSYKQETVFGATPSGRFYGSNRSSVKSFYPWLKISHNLSSSRSLNVSYNSGYNASLNNLAGRFDLPDRAFDSKLFSHQLRTSESGYIGKSFLNELRFQYTFENLKTDPLSDKTTINVLDAFSDGGAGNKFRSSKQNFWLADNLLFGAGKIHALKVGGLLEYERRDTKSAINQNGTYIFSSLADYISGNPTTFTQNSGIRKVNLAQLQIGAFVQDDIRLTKSFMLSAGLRYEWQSNLQDKNNFSPRLGFTWSPSKSGKMTFRGGAGLYYNWLETNNLATVLSQSVTQPGTTVIVNPGYPNALSGGANLILPPSYWQLAASSANPYVFLASIGMERQLSKTTSLRVLYKYQKGIHQFRSRDINAPLADTLIRPDTSLGRIVQVESSAFFAQNSLNIGLNSRLSKRISYGIDYTLAKNTSDADGIFGLPSDNYNLRLERSASNLDQRHRIYASVYWKILNGLNLSTVYLINSSLPYNITTGFDNNGDTIFNDRPAGVARNSEYGTWQKQVNVSLNWTIGFGKKDAKSGGGLIVVSGNEEAGGADVNHRCSLKFYTTANNVLNQTNFTNFAGVQTSPFYRQPIAADNARRLEAGVRFSF